MVGGRGLVSGSTGKRLFVVNKAQLVPSVPVVGSTHELDKVRVDVTPLEEEIQGVRIESEMTKQEPVPIYMIPDALLSNE